MEKIVPLIRAVCILLAAGLLGNWFLTENKKAKAAGRPWYAVYLTPPGLLLIGIIVLLPFAISFLK